MAHFDRVNGEVVKTTGVPVAFVGKTLKFYGMVVRNGSGTALDLSTHFGVDEAIDVITREVASKASVLMIQSDQTGVLSYCLDSAEDVYTAATLQAAIRALGTAGGVDVSGTTVTDVGFKLAAS